MGALGKGSLWCSLCLTGPVQDYKTELRPKLAEGFDQNYAKPQLCPKIRPKPYKPEDPKTVVRTTPQTLIQVLRRPKTTGFNPPRLDCSSVRRNPYAALTGSFKASFNGSFKGDLLEAREEPSKL